MGAEFFQWAQLIVSAVGLGSIFVGLVRMKESGQRRDREIDEMARAFTHQGEALERQGEAMTQAFTQQGEVLGQIGRALDRQGEAMTQAFTQQGEALKQQGQVLAELLRRSA